LSERLNPRDLLARGNTGAHNNVRAIACFAMGRYREGIEFARKTIIDSPAMPTAHRVLLINSALAGETGEARAALQTPLNLRASVVSSTRSPTLPAEPYDLRNRDSCPWSLSGTFNRPARSCTNCQATRPDREPRVVAHSNASRRNCSGATPIA
jgi:hypothetical protein